MAQLKQSSRHVCDVLKLKLPMRSSPLLLWLSSWDLRSSCISAERRNRFSILRGTQNRFRTTSRPRGDLRRAKRSARRKN